MKKISNKLVLIGLLLIPTIAYALCHQECIPAGPWEPACPICNYDIRSQPECVHHLSEHSGCDYSGIIPLIRHPIFMSDPPDWTYDDYVPDCIDSSPSC